MAGQSAVQVGSGFIRVIAKTLPEDYNRFKQQWQQGIEQALSGINLSTPIISNQAATHQGQQAGQHIASGAQQAVQQQAGQITAPIAQQGPSLGHALGKGIVAGIATFKAGELMMKGLGTAVESSNIGSKLQASMGLTGEQAAKFQDSMRNIFTGGYTASMDEASVAIESVVSSIDGMKDASTSTVEDITKKVLTMSNAFEIDAGQGAQVLGQMIRTGMVKDASEGADLLTATLQKVPKETRSAILDAVDEYGPFFKTLGLSGEESMNLLATGAKKGQIGIDKVGDAMKELTIRASDQSTTTLDAYKAIGVDATKMTAGILKGGAAGKEAFGEIVNGLLNMKDPAARSQAALSLFGTQLEDLNVSEIKTFLEGLKNTNGALGDTKGAAQKAGDALNSGLGFETQKLKNTFQTTLGDIAIPLMQTLIPILQGAAQWLSQNKEWLVQWGGPLLTIGIILGGIVTAVNTFTVIAGVLGPIIGALTAAQFTWNAALFASPLFIWTVVIAGVILAIILLATHWQEVTQFIGDSINWVMGLLTSLGEQIAHIFDAITSLFSGDWTGNMGATLSVLMPHFANGGLVKATPGGSVVPGVGVVSEAGQNEIIMNEGLYNKNSEAQTNLINSVVNNGVAGGPAVVQNNSFPNVNPREVESILVGQINQQTGAK